MRVGGEDPVGRRVVDEVDRLRADGNLRDGLVALEVDDRDPVAARAGNVGATARDVETDAFGIEADCDRCDRAGVGGNVDPAGGPNAEFDRIRWSHRLM